MKKLKSTGQFLTALSLAVVLSFSTVVPAHAADPLTVAGLVASGVQVLMQAVQMYVEADSQADRDAAISEMMTLWRSTVYASSTIEVSADVLQDTCMELNSSGFPCEVVWNDVIGGFVIKGVNYVYIPDLITSRTINIANRYFSNMQGYTFYATAASDTSIFQSIENMLQNICSRLDTLTNTLAMQDPLEEWLELFYLQNDVVHKYLELISYQIDEVVEAVSNISISADGGTILFNTAPITDKLDELIMVLQNSGGGSGHVDIVEAIERYHQDFNDYFSQFGDSIDYASYDETITDHELLSWNTSSQSYEGGTLTDGSIVTVVRVPELSDTHTGQNTSPYVEFSSAGYPRILSGSSAALPHGLRFIYDGAVREISFAGTSGIGAAIGSEVVLEDSGSDPMRVTYYGKTTQAGTPSMSVPIPLNDVTGEYLDFVYTDGSSQTAHLAAPMPSGGLRGLPVNSGGNYTDADGQDWIADEVDGSTGLYTQRVGSVVFDGSSDENWVVVGSGSTLYFRIPYWEYGYVDANYELCSHLPVASITSSTTNVGINVINSSTVDAGCVTLRLGSGIDTVSELKAKLAASPITVYYLLAVPETEQLHLPNSVEYPSVGNSFPGYTSGYEVNGAQLKVVYTTRNPITELYADADGSWHWKYRDGSIKSVTDPSVLHVLQEAFHTRTYTSGDLIVFNDGLNSVHVSDGGTLTFHVMQGNKIIVWFVNWQHSSRDWLDQKLDTLQITSGGGSDLTPVIDRMDTIIENLGAEVGVTGCDHVYVSEINQDQTCILPGLQTFTCESCGSSYSEILASLGHDWLCTGHVADQLDPETGEVVSSGYDIYTCSRCSDSYNDYEGSGAPATESTSLTGIVSRVFEKLGTLVGDLLSMGIRLLDKLLTGFDDLVTNFNEKTQQIVNFGSGYTAWLSGFWDVVPSDLQLAWGFCLVVVCLGIVGKKLFFTP